MKLEFKKEDLVLAKSLLSQYSIKVTSPHYDDFLSDIMYSVVTMGKRNPDYLVKPGLKRMIMQRSILNSMQKLYAKKRRYILPEWCGADPSLASVPSTVEARIDAQKAFDLLPEQAQDIVLNRLMGDNDTDFAKANNISKQAISLRIRKHVKKVKKELR